MGTGKSKHSAGWYAGALVFWLLSAWLITVGLSSIIPQIFWPAGDVKAQASSCLPALRELQRSLITRTTQSIATPRSHSHDELLAWFEHWDVQLYQAKPNCRDDERAAWVQLIRLRHRMQDLLEGFERNEVPEFERLEQLLGKPTAEARAHFSEDHTP